MTTLTTSSGTEYWRDGQVAWPKAHPNRPRYFPADLWDADCAEACGVLVDATIPPGDYRVRGAGPEWREVYDLLRAAQ